MFSYEDNLQNEFYNTYTIKKGDTLYKIAASYNTNPKLIAELNGLKIDDYIYTGDVLKVPLKNVKYYITKEDDTLKEVSNIFEKNENELVYQNKTIYLLPGQMIFYKEK